MKDKSWDSRWEKLYRSQEWGKYPPEELVRFIARNYYNAPKRNKVSILDLGCGTGAATWFIAREGFDTYGIDGSATGIEIAKERFAKEKLKADLRVGDIVLLPYGDEQFDAVDDIACVQHNTPENITKIVAEIHRTLKPKGKFFGMMIAKNTGVTKWDGQTHFFTKPEIRKFFKGFASVSIDSVTRTKDGGKSAITFWLVEATK